VAVRVDPRKGASAEDPQLQGTYLALTPPPPPHPTPNPTKVSPQEIPNFKLLHESPRMPAYRSTTSEQLRRSCLSRSCPAAP
jgi:hypothetical protein